MQTIKIKDTPQKLCAFWEPRIERELQYIVNNTYCNPCCVCADILRNQLNHSNKLKRQLTTAVFFNTRT